MKNWLDKYKDGGKTEKPKNNPVIPSYFNSNKPSKYPLQFTKTEQISAPGGGLMIASETREVPDVRNNYMLENYVSTIPTKQVNFKSAIKNKSASQFLNRYNDPWTRQKLQEQSGLTNYDVDNMILQGLSPSIEQGNTSGSKGEYDSVTNKILMNTPDAAVETHERVHASNFDAAQGEYLQNVLGNPFQQEGKNTFNNVKKYMQKPHEAYGNFVEFREKIGLKPGEQITPEELKKRVEKNNLLNENFYKVYNDKNITKALNTVASDNDNLQPLNIAQNGAQMNYYKNGLDFKPKMMQQGGIIEDDMGQWNHPGKITKINSNNITMQSVNYPVYGISDEGDEKLMFPNKNYKFKGSNVTEYPLAQNGKELDQLINFTNYNTPQPGGWLNKYN